MNNTKTKIISAAIEVFSRNHTASMEEIAESIDLNRRTLHRYFSGKSELIEEIIDYASSLCLQKTKDSIKSSNNPIHQLKSMFLNDIESGHQFRFLYNFRNGFQGMEKKSKDFEEMMLLFRDLLETIQSNNLFYSQLTLDWIESLYFSTIDAAINLIIADYSKKELVTEMALTSYLNAVIKHSKLV